MYYVGVDLHKRASWFYVMDEFGKRYMSKSIINDDKILKECFEAIPKPFNLAVEATYNWYFFVDLAEQYAEKTYLANSYELKAFAKRHKKTDKIDARLIADILRKGYLPSVTIPDKKTRGMKEFLRYRMNLVTDRSRNIFRFKALLDKLGKKATGDFTCRKRIRAILNDKFEPKYAKIIAGYVKCIEDLSDEIKNAEKFIQQFTAHDPDIINLISIPGISYFSGALIKTEIIDIDRFASFGRLCAYAGLAPRVSQSANKNFHGSLNINRRKKLQWILIETVYHFVNALPEKQKKYAALVERKGANTAKIVMARDLLKIIYHILKEKRSFYERKFDSYNCMKIRSAAAPALCGV